MAFCDHAPFFEEPVKAAFPSIGAGLQALPGGVRDSGVKMDVAHLIIMRLGYQGINPANANAGTYLCILVGANPAPPPSCHHA